MKIKQLIVLGAAACISLGATANTSSDKELQFPKKQVAKLNFDNVDFGSYKVEKNLRLVPSSVASDDHVVMRKGEITVVSVETSSDVVTKGTLVRNIFTNNLTSLSGNITILLKDGMSASDVASAAGLKVVSLFPGTKIAVLAVNDGQDILVASKQLKASGLIKEAKIEVLETIYTAQ
ncbi:hypothetical protein AN392_02844 [Pseudoalteromonas sp. P1-16-1b]|uniref:hypothetical protein n=1 Tax=Pseudoalteromonas sp. P1-16-1b TaxID=1723757 RepID=UPI0006D6598F|nr:hypothetical protein [Pseudoalteromonas sp. P1-16-1b]KPZ63889.1 hypothetical protein AN392_02844 [Pseudoalteromonas sp. P1-16-1b]